MQRMDSITWGVVMSNAEKPFPKQQITLFDWTLPTKKEEYEEDVYRQMRDNGIRIWI